MFYLFFISFELFNGCKCIVKSFETAFSSVTTCYLTKPASHHLVAEWIFVKVTTSFWLWFSFLSLTLPFTQHLCWGYRGETMSRNLYFQDTKRQHFVMANFFFFNLTHTVYIIYWKNIKKHLLCVRNSDEPTECHRLCDV